MKDHARSPFSFIYVKAFFFLFCLDRRWRRFQRTSSNTRSGTRRATSTSEPPNKGTATTPRGRTMSSCPTDGSRPSGTPSSGTPGTSRTFPTPLPAPRSELPLLLCRQLLLVNKARRLLGGSTRTCNKQHLSEFPSSSKQQGRRLTRSPLTGLHLRIIRTITGTSPPCRGSTTRPRSSSWTTKRWVLYDDPF